MRGVALLSTLFVACLVLSGCTSKPSSSSSSTESSASETLEASGAMASSDAGNASTETSTASTSSSGTAAPGASGTTAVDHAPIITTFKANSTGLNGFFTFNATDADKDALAFHIAFGDNVTGQGTFGAGNSTAKAAHAYAAPGNYTVKLTVSDGKLSTNKTLLVAITTAATAAGGTNHDFSCTVTVGMPVLQFSASGTPITTQKCVLTTTSSDSVYVAGSPGSGCTFDMGSGAPTVGASYPSGTEFDMLCTSPGVMLSGTITLRY